MPAQRQRGTVFPTGAKQAGDVSREASGPLQPPGWVLGRGERDTEAWPEEKGAETKAKCEGTGGVSPGSVGEGLPGCPLPSFSVVPKRRHRASVRLQEGRLYLSGRKCFERSQPQVAGSGVPIRGLIPGLDGCKHRGMSQERRIQASSIRGLGRVARNEQSAEL